MSQRTPHEGQAFDLGDGLYDFRARVWSTHLGAFLQPDEYQFLSRGGTLWSWPGQNPFRWRDPSGRYGLEDLGNDFYRHSETMMDASLAVSGVAFTIATFGAGAEVGLALATGRLTLGAAARFGAVGALKGGALGGGVEAGRQWATSDCPPDYGRIGGAAATGAAVGALFGARGAIGAGGGITNPVPNTVARVIPGEGPFPTLGPPGSADVFVTAADDIAGMTAQQIAQRLSISPANTFTVVEFATPAEGLASPILRSTPGFVGRGLTAGGAREFTLPNGPMPAGAIMRLVGP